MRGKATLLFEPILAFGVGKGLLCLFARVSLKDVGLSRVSKQGFEGGFEKPD